jgi:sugar lactone lactonase YvrE
MRKLIVSAFLTSTLFGAVPLVFEENRGQADPRALFLAHGARYSAFITRQGATLSLGGHAVTLTLRGADPRARPEAASPAEGVSNYIRGTDPALWIQGVPHYARVRVPNARPGLDLIYYGTESDLEYDLLVAPGASTKSLRLEIQGADSLSLNAAGDLVIHTPAGDLTQHRPLATQGARRIDASYAILNPHEVALRVGRHDPRQPLTIDPVVTYSAVLGGSSTDEAKALAVDAAGNAYIAGRTASTNFPSAAGALHGGSDAFVCKLNAAGTALLYSTYLGGQSDEQALGIVIDGAGSAYVTGSTGSVDFPVLPAGSGRLTGLSNGFVTRLGPTGAVLSSRVFGGSGTDASNAIALDTNGSVWVTGSTTSPDFPLYGGTLFPGSPSASQSMAFAAKLSPGGPILFSTFLNYGNGNAIAVDAQGNGYVAGSGAVVTKINAGGSAVVYSATVGSPSGTLGGIAVDAAGSAYVTGSTNGLGLHVFAAKLTPSGSGVVYSTTLGTGNFDRGLQIAVDPTGSAYVTGDTSMLIPSATSGALRSDTTYSGFFAKLDPTGAVSYSTYLGDGFGSTPWGLALDPQGHVYIAGIAGGSAFPVTAGSPSVPSSKVNQIGPTSAFVTKIDLASPVICGISISPQSATLPPAGGAGQFTITNPAGCPYEIAQDNGVAIPGQTAIDGFGSQTFAYIVTPNAGTNSYAIRALGTPATPGSSVLTITLSSAGCTATSLTPASVNFPAAGGTGAFQPVLSDPFCQWTGVSSDVGWLQILTGNSTVGTFAVAPNNTTQPRSGTITVANRSIAVTQAAATAPVTVTTPALLPTAAIIAPNGFGYSGDQSPALTARFSYTAGGMARDQAGNLYIADAGNSRVRQIDTNGIITTFAGGGSAGSGDGGPPTSAELNHPTGVAVDAAGNVYILESFGQSIRKVSNSVITTLVGTGLDFPSHMVMDPAGNLYVSTFSSGIKKIAPNGTVTPYWNTSAQITWLALDGAGNLYFTYPGSYAVNKLTPAGVVSTVAGNGYGGPLADGIPATQAGMDLPMALAIDTDGSLLIIRFDGIERVTSDGIIHTVPTPLNPLGPFIPDGTGNFYELDQSGALYKVASRSVPVCSYNVTAPARTSQYSGNGFVSFAVATPAACQYSLSSLTSWIQTGPGAATFSLSANTAQSARTGSVVVAGQIFTVTQNGSPAFPDNFVTSIYQDALNRDPDSAGLAYWSGLIGSGALTRAQLAAQFLSSPESRNGPVFVNKLYVALLGYDPDYAGWRNWSGGTGSTVSLVQTFLKVATPQTNAINTLDYPSLVAWAYQNLLGRAADSAGTAYFVGQLNSGALTRAGLIDAFLHSAEYDARALPRAYANLLYLALLRRTADPSGLTYWTGVLTNPANLTGVVATFLNSQEYIQRY